ncbi:MAG: sulfite exporter TauE/SafE family protein [Phreatobacter sp.]|nr:sulfite exporter TauE/SafE family protein [Phreatobacter sp.]
MITDPFFYVVAVPAVILYGLSKGGFSGVAILSMPLLSLAISPIQAAAIMLPVLMVQDVVSVWSYRRTWDKATLIHLAPGALAGILAGYLFAAHVSEPAVRIIVGIIAVAFCLDRWLRPPPAGGEQRPHNWFSGSILGTLCGYTSFVIHVGGPPFNMYAMPRGLSRDVFVGSAALFFAAVNLVKVTPFIALGQLTVGNLATAATLFPLAVLANMGGIWLVRRVPTILFYRIIYILTFGVGCVLLADGVRAVL